MLKNINNKGQIGITITWFVGFIIIMFVLFLFLLMTAYFSVIRLPGQTVTSLLSSNKPEVQIESVSQTETLMGILNTPVEVQVGGSKRIMKMSDLIKLSLNGYTGATWGYYDRQGLIVLDVNNAGGDSEASRALFANSQSILRKICPGGAILVLPQGAVISSSGSKFVSLADAEGELNTGDFNFYSFADMNYGGNIIKIKYSQLKSCG